MRTILISLFAMLLPISQTSTIDSLVMYHAITAGNSGKIQQEMIYLHLDNTSYYSGDSIFFACYLVTSGKLLPSNLSQTVYVELLNPSGKVINRCVLKSENGRCHGSLPANETPFYSGYYEIRAYTRYMLNFGPTAIYSRVIPIYAPPQKEGDWSERTILKQNSKTLKMLRPKPQKVDKIELRFYPEGGHLVSGLPARVAFELTDAARRPLSDVAGRIIDRTTDNIVATFRSGHMGRVYVDFTPAARRYYAEVMVDGKRYRCDLPAVEPDGIALRVNSQQEPDSVEVTVSRTPACPTEAVGVSMTCRGELYGRSIVDLTEQLSTTFKLPVGQMPSGVAQLTLFNAEGQSIADRLFFHNRHEFVNVEYTFDKNQYRPYEKIELKVRTTDSKTGEPISVPFSISVTDADNHIAYGSNIMADLLLASEIKGYVHNQAYYFEAGREADLDNLLMVQGWRRYSWRQLAGMEPIRLDSLPEQGIEVSGQVLERARNRPRAGIFGSAMLLPVDTTNRIGPKAKTHSFFTDENGRFMFRDTLYGDYTMTIFSSDKQQRSKNRILLDLSKRPEPRGYDVGELQADLHIPATKYNITTVADTLETSFAVPGTIMLSEVEVTAKHGTAVEMARYMESSIASYDIMHEVDVMRDTGKKNLRYLPDALINLDKKFHYNKGASCYNGKQILFISDPEFGSNKGVIDELIGVEDILFSDDVDTPKQGINPGNIPIDFIKKIYVNTQQEVIMTYSARMVKETMNKSRMDILMNDASKYG